MRRALSSSALALTLAACSYDGPCGGDRPALSDCAGALSFAECGGTGDPTLACDDSGRCLWFSDACLARGFRATDCPAGDVCCHASGDGEWPWASWGPSEPGAASRLARDVAMIGAQRITRTAPAGLAVVVAPLSGSPPASPTLTCTGDPALAPCATGVQPLGPVRAHAEGDSVVLAFAADDSTASQELVVEIVPQYDGRYRARLFARALADEAGDARACGAPSSFFPTQDGMLALDAVDPSRPESLRGTLTANVAAGSIVLRF